MPDRTCSGCGVFGRICGRGLCDNCYAYRRRHGTLPDALKSPKDRVPRWVESMRDEPGCWDWPWSHSAAGYGVISRDGKVQYLHRMVYEMEKGPIASGLEIDHLCRNRGCCNPAHQEPVTHAENIRRAQPSHCKRGHPLSGPNVIARKNGTKRCLACNRIYNARRRYIPGVGYYARGSATVAPTGQTPPLFGP